MAGKDDKGTVGDELKGVLGGGTDVALFEGQRIRRVWLDGRWYFSVVDVVGLLSESTEPRTYWAVLKGRLRGEGADETLTNCKQLRMLAADGKQRLTDCADVAILLRIVQSAPPHPSCSPMANVAA